MKQLQPATCCSVYSRWLRALTLVMRKVHTALRSTSWRLFQEYRVAKRRNQLFWREVRFRSLSVKAEFRLWGWYGRIGNNVQQLIVAIAHAEEFGGCTGMDEKLLKEAPLNGILNPFWQDFRPDRKATDIYDTIFFHYTEYTFNRRDLRAPRIIKISGYNCVEWTIVRFHIFA